VSPIEPKTKSGARQSAPRRHFGAHPEGIATGSAPLHRELAEKLQGLPWDLGLSLVSLGTIGVLIPGPVPLGPSFVLLGGVVLCPSLLARTGGPLARKCPYVFRVLIDFTDHLRSDLDRRYPGSLRD
jgi:hypothetical protein